MKNAIIPPVSSQLYSFGSNEVISDVPAQMDSKVNLHGNSFFIDSALYNNDDQIGGGFAISSPSPIYCQSGPSSIMGIERLDYPYPGATYLTTTSSFDIIPQQPLSLTKKLSVRQYDSDFHASQNGRKRPIEVVNDLRPKQGSINLVSSKCGVNEWTRNKKVALFHEQRHHKAKEDRLPVKRSQKLSDKITALQKLVSPYGKTDTASVLQEAFTSIKLLQDQIQNQFHKLNTLYINANPLHSQKNEEKKLDLRSRGLCLVPASFTHKLTDEDQFN